MWTPLEVWGPKYWAKGLHYLVAKRPEIFWKMIPTLPFHAGDPRKLAIEKVGSQRRMDQAVLGNCLKELKIGSLLTLRAEALSNMCLQWTGGPKRAFVPCSLKDT